MTTSPVTSVTDELIAELEQIYMAGWQASGEGWNAEYPGDAHETKPFIEIMRNACGPVAAKLLAERAELKRDAERLQWMIEQQCLMQWQNGTRLPLVYSLAWPMLSKCQGEWYTSAREAIDAAMQNNHN